MFEDALVESNHRIKTRSRYWSVVAVFINSGALIALVLWPLLHPQALPTQVMASLLVAPPSPIPPQTVPVVRVANRSRSLENEIETPSRLDHATTIVTDPSELQQAVTPIFDTAEMGDNHSSLTGLLDGMATRGPAVRPAAREARPTVSSGVMDGNLLEKTDPQYPTIAREARIQGTVVLQATIGKDGAIQNLRVVSGPPMLQQAALAAVRSWRYKPFLLNGSPVAVETTVNVVFKLGD
jgi:periplasmic protein TonB